MGLRACIFVCVCVCVCLCVRETGSPRGSCVSQSQPGIHWRTNCQSRGHEIKTHHQGKKGEKKVRGRRRRRRRRRWRRRRVVVVEEKQRIIKMQGRTGHNRLAI